jgi:osmotically inducible protein OsmC
MPLQVLYTAHATAVGGRNGHTESSDGLVKADLSVPKAMGGPGKPGTTTPEDLFAAGYAACFGGAVDLAARLKKLPATDVSIACAVAIGKMDDGGFGLKAELTASMKGVSQQQAQEIVDSAHQICPYSKATRGNIEVTVKAVAR